MKPHIKIILITLIVWPKIFFGQTYFNMLYAPEAGTWGGGTRAIVITDTAYYMNRWFADNAFGKLGNHLTILDINGINYEVSDTVHSTNQWVATAGLNQTNSKSFIDISSIHNYNPSTQQYGVVKYDSIGHIIFHNIDTNLYPYIYKASN